MKRDYKPAHEKPVYASLQEATHNFEPCFLCWRSMLKKPLEKKTPLCHLHDLPSTHNEYRKRVRLKKHVENTRLELIKKLPPLTPRKRELGAELNAYVKSLCLSASGQLPYLAEYLQSFELFSSSTELEIIQALESPVYKQKLSSFTLQVWELYLNDKAKHFRLNYIQLLTAEAWLQAESTCKHGGKRR